MFTSNGQSYRHLAAELRRQAAESTSADIRRDLLLLAERYDRLAGNPARRSEGRPSLAGPGWLPDGACD